MGPRYFIATLIPLGKIKSSELPKGGVAGPLARKTCSLPFLRRLCWKASIIVWAAPGGRGSCRAGRARLLPSREGEAPAEPGNTARQEPRPPRRGPIEGRSLSKRLCGG